MIAKHCCLKTRLNFVETGCCFKIKYPKHIAGHTGQIRYGKLSSFPYSLVLAISVNTPTCLG